MTHLDVQIEPAHQALAADNEHVEPKRHVLWRRGDGIFTEDEHVAADQDAVDHWDARQWRDRPLR